MTRDPIRALVVGIDDEHYRELTQEEGFTVETRRTPERGADGDVDAVVVALTGEPTRHARDAPRDRLRPPP